MNIFLFHRDLRLIDNNTLIKQVKIYKKIIPIFIFPPCQIDPSLNPYFSHHSVQFMVESLKELSGDIKKMGGELYFFMGDNLAVLKDLHEICKINSIGFNVDYTPFAKKRDKQISEWAESQKIKIQSEQDYGMYPMLKGLLLNEKSQKPYLVFTPFRNYCYKNLQVVKPSNFKDFVFETNKKINSTTYSFPQQKLDSLYTKNHNLVVKGGRSNGIQIMLQLKKFKNYNKTRNLPSLPTTKLSAYLHFNCISIRELYHAAVDQLGMENNIINQIHWREFYMCITNYFPKVLQGKSFQPKFDNLKWKYDQKLLKCWKQGKTGFPIVDAAMREMNTTGWMHNRCRMIVASFFAKDLFLDWHQGERYFATKLVDYSPMQNSGGWQWTVGNGTDAAPYFRIFNPWTQQKNYDEQCIYIKKYIIELKNVPNQAIHNWYHVWKEYHKKRVDYPAPIVEHDQARKETLQTYNHYFAKK